MVFGKYGTYTEKLYVTKVLKMLPASGGQVRTNQNAGLVTVPSLKVELLGEVVQSPINI